MSKDFNNYEEIPVWIPTSTKRSRAGVSSPGTVKSGERQQSKMGKMCGTGETSALRVGNLGQKAENGGGRPEVGSIKANKIKDITKQQLDLQNVNFEE
ncbi:hypothetical protein L596_014588 [Steinernema carpocapsae]|uniref:Uncharacterized protein n=1 Tax=Steinernema carpocapsae TaxID=34508 RepID=A0A4U5ND70_STECR|nr:hypothetical protein L596_014588 [Steinernema carpocapsae]